MKVDNFISNRLKNYIQYISVTTHPPKYLFLATRLLVFTQKGDCVPSLACPTSPQSQLMQMLVPLWLKNYAKTSIQMVPLSIFWLKHHAKTSIQMVSSGFLNTCNIILTMRLYFMNIIGSLIEYLASYFKWSCWHTSSLIVDFPLLITCYKKYIHLVQVERWDRKYCKRLKSVWIQSLCIQAIPLQFLNLGA